MAKLHYAARRASLPVDICSTFPNPSCYHPETELQYFKGHTNLFVVSAAGCDASVSVESANAN